MPTVDEFVDYLKEKGIAEPDSIERKKKKKFQWDDKKLKTSTKDSKYKYDTINKRYTSKCSSKKSNKL